MFDPTPELIKDFWLYMTTTYNSKAIGKADSEFMAVVAGFLSRLKIMDQDAFMKETPSSVGHWLYVSHDSSAADETKFPWYTWPLVQNSSQED
jgi:putative lipoic acid-binding regulatory protein